MTTIKTDQRVTDLVRADFAGKERGFRPFAVYHAELDMLVAITQDCSILELPVESGLVILQKTQPIEGQGSYAGFMIESVGGLCSRRNIALEGSVELVPVLRAFLAEHPALSGWVGFIDRLAHENNITHFSVG